MSPDPAASVRGLETVLESFDELWSPRLLAQVNDHDLKLAKIQGSYVWHSHPDSDELFLVVDGSLEIHLRTGDSEPVVTLGPHDLYVVPKGIEHCPVSETGASVLLIELAGTLSTGDFAGEVPAHITSTTGKEASP
ncbi:MAG: cupin domain-containing protein [Nocardioides sp.]